MLDAEAVSCPRDGPPTLAQISSDDEQSDCEAFTATNPNEFGQTLLLSSNIVRRDSAPCWQPRLLTGPSRRANPTHSPTPGVLQLGDDRVHGLFELPPCGFVPGLKGAGYDF